MSIAVLGGKLYINHLKSMNSVNKDIKDLVSVIIALVTNISRRGHSFYDGVIHTGVGKIDHFLKHLHGRIIMGTFEIFLHEGYLWRGHKEVIYFIPTKTYVVNFILHGDQFYNQYIKSKIGTRYIDGDVRV